MKNILQGLGNVFGGLTQNGRGLFDILEDISTQFENLTASREFQSILSELAQTADSLVQNVLPLLLQAFEELGPVIEIIGPPLRDFIDQIGPQLLPVIEELGPILQDLAIILRDQMPTAIAFVGAALEELVVILKGVHFVLENFVIPILRGVADVFNSEFVQAIAGGSRDLADRLGEVITKFDEFRDRITGVVSTVTGNIGQLKDAVGRQLAEMAANALSAAQRFVSNLVGKAVQAKDSFLREIATLVARAVAFVASLPGRIIGALAGLPGRMSSIGRNIVAGLVGGLLSQLANLRSVASQIAATVAGAIANKLKIHSPSLLMFGYGQNTVQGFINGVLALLPQLQATVGNAFGSAVAPFGPQVAAVGAPAAVAAAPVVYVQIGNEAVDQFVTTRVEQVNATRDRNLSYGVRR